MKTTVDIDPDLLRSAKKVAIDRGCTLRELMEQGLRQVVASPKIVPESAPRRMRWTTAPGPIPPPPGVDYADGRSLRAWIMRERGRGWSRLTPIFWCSPMTPHVASTRPRVKRCKKQPQPALGDGRCR
ncbi:MAG: hypothetical protein ACRD01_16335 [Terriglobales bacterium]